MALNRTNAVAGIDAHGSNFHDLTRPSPADIEANPIHHQIKSNLFAISSVHNITIHEFALRLAGQTGDNFALTSAHVSKFFDPTQPIADGISYVSVSDRYNITRGKLYLSMLLLYSATVDEENV